MSVEKLMDTPCWASLSHAMMRKWEPPAGVEHVTICADNDPHRAGQEAAEALAVRLREMGIDVHIRVPPDPHKDWNDVLMKESRAGAQRRLRW